MDWAQVLPVLVGNGWAVAIVLVLGLIYFMATDRLATRGRLRSMEKDRDYWRRAAELERERSDRASASVTRMLPAAEQAVKVVESFTQLAESSGRVPIERGE